MKILLTGAHFTTAVAVIEELKKHKNIEILYVGRQTTREGDSALSPESQILPQLGVKFIPITTGRLQRSFTIYTIPSLLKIPVGFLQAFLIILKEKPDITFSFGGYVAVPLVIWSWLLSIPVMIHEQTLVTGLANKISSFFADKIAVSFDKSYKFNKDKIILTGNPLRNQILNPDKNLLGEEYKKIFAYAKKNKLPVILITGGNQGSHVINIAVEESLRDLTKIAYLIHQTGDSTFNDFERLSRLQSEEYLVKKFINQEMGTVLSMVDLCVSRAGINILTELAFLSKPALLIPVPFIYQDEQNKNAHFFKDLGLVQILSQSKLSGKTLLENVNQMLKNLPVLKNQAKFAKEVIVLDAAKKITLEVLLLLNKTSTHG